MTRAEDRKESMHTVKPDQGWSNDIENLTWLSSCDRLAMFVFSEVPSWLGSLGEVAARALQPGTAHLDVHLWTRATAYQQDSGIPPITRARGIEEAVLNRLHVRGGGRALVATLQQMAPGRVTCDDRLRLADPERAAFTETLSEYARGPLRDVKYQGLPAGWAVFGNLSNLTLSADATDLVDEDHTQTMLRSFASTFDAAREILTQNRPTAIIIFNGRWLHEWATREAAAALRIPTLVVEAGRSEQHFSTYWESAHDPQGYSRRLLVTWESKAGLAPERASELAHEWFTSRRTSPTSGNPFVQLQVSGVAPPRSDGRRRVVFYTSSSDELVAAGSQWLSPFGTQEEVLARLAERAREDPTIELVVRIHPHTLLKNPRDLASWRIFEQVHPDVLVVPADSTVDSYALAESADLVLSMGSTMGVEAAYWGIPSATLSPSLYDSTGAVSVVDSLDDCLSLDVDEDERARRRERSLIWGLYCATLGTPFSLYRPEPPLYPFAGRPLARRGWLQALVPPAVTRRRTAVAAARLRARWG